MSDYKELINEDYVILITPNGNFSPQQPTELMVESSKVLTGQNIDKKSITFRYMIFQNSCIYPGYTHISGFGQINTTAEKNFIENFLPFRKEDEGQCNGFFKSVTDGAVVSCNCNLKFYNAGQVKVLAK